MFIREKTKGPQAATHQLPLGNKEPINGSVSIVMSLSSLVNPPGNQTNPEPKPQRSRSDPGAKRHTSGSPRIIRRDERNLRSTHPPARKQRSRNRGVIRNRNAVQHQSPRSRSAPCVSVTTSNTPMGLTSVVICPTALLQQSQSQLRLLTQTASPSQQFFQL